MAQSGFTPIQLFRTTTAAAVPTAGNLAAGELAINLTDERLYFKNAAGVVKLLASNSGALGTVTSVDVSGGTTGLTTSGGPITSSGTITLAGTLGVANGGTGTATAFTAGSVVFAGASGVYSQDNANFFWDNTNDRLGIGTATPSQKLQVSGSSTSPVAISINNNDPGLSAGAKVSFAYGGAETGYVINQFDGVDFFNAYRANRGHYFLIGATEVMRVAADGNVGIGTSSPGTKLDVQGTVAGNFFQNLYNDSSNAAAQTLYLAKSFGASGVQFGQTRSSANGFVNLLDAAALTFGTSNTERMRIDSSGNVGIGTSSPVSGGFLTVGSGAGSSTAVQYLNAGSGGSALIGRISGNNTWFVGDTAAALGSGTGVVNLVYGNNPWTVYTNSIERMRVEGSGNVGIGTSSPGSKLTVSGTVNFTGALTSGDLADAVGYKGLPQNQQTSNYTLALADQGEHIFATAAAFTITIPLNSSVAFPIGTALSIFTGDAAKTLAPAAGVSLVQAGTANTGSRTLGINSLVTLIKLQTNTWVVSGAGLS
jgi:hypothetical protein